MSTRLPNPPRGAANRSRVVTMRRIVLAAATGALLLAGLQPAAGATTPDKVGLVSFTNASFTQSSRTASLTLDWASTPGAKSYEVYMSKQASMSDARKLRAGTSTIKVSDLPPDTDYFFRVRGVNGSKEGEKSTRVGHTTIIDQGTPTGTAYRVMSYNVCSRVCDEKKTTPYWWKWSSTRTGPSRQPGAMERIATYAPDVLAAQEANFLETPPGFTLAMDYSGKQLYFRTSRFTVARGSTPDSQSCDTKSPPDAPEVGSRVGYICIGKDHGGGNRYAVWAELVDKRTQKHTMFVDVHTVTGDDYTAATQRREEIKELFRSLKYRVNRDSLPVVFAGDFNSHKNRAHDYVADVMHQNGYYDAYDLATSLTRQHYNTYNDFERTPKISYTWGDHVDHVWVVPGSSYVPVWANGVLIEDGRLPNPIPSDHSPLVVDVKIN